MKLSEIKGEKAIEVIAELIDPVAEIASDENLKALFNIRPETGESPTDAAMRVLKKSTPELLKNHKKEVIKMLAVLEGKDPDKMSLSEIVKGLLEMASDHAFVQLFSSAVLTEEAPPIEDFKA